MARDFTKNTSNYMSIGVNQIQPLINGASAISIYALVNLDSFNTGANDNRIITVGVADNLAGIIMEVVGSAGAEVLKIAARSVSTDSLQSKLATTVVTTGAWHSCGGVINIGGDTITPYYEGVAEGGGAVTFGNTTWTNGTPTQLDTIGAGQTAPVSSIIQTDGRIAELAIWTADIGLAGFSQLLDRLSPLSIRPDALVNYWSLLGNNSPETDTINAKNGTITGTIAKADHPRIIYPYGDPTGVRNAR